MPTQKPDDLLTLSEVADLIGVALVSIQRYHQRATERRRTGKATDTTMPAPDQHFGRTPVWKRSAIVAWDAAREKRPNTRKGQAA